MFIGDFIAGFSTAMASAAADQVIAEQKAVINAILKGKGRDTSLEAYNPLSTALLDEANSQTIIIDMVTNLAPSIHLYNSSNMLLQRCE
jgi:riboflavin biosynthesis pyrimidine reductase